MHEVALGVDLALTTPALDLPDRLDELGVPRAAHADAPPDVFSGSDPVAAVCPSETKSKASPNPQKPNASSCSGMK